MNAESKRDNLTPNNLLLTSYDKSINIQNKNKSLTKSSTSNPTTKTQAPSPVKMSHPLHTPPSVPYPDPEPIDLGVLVPLEHEWTWWHDVYPGPNLTVEEYEASLKPIGTFGTVQDFWRWFNNMPTPGQLGMRMSYHIMKQGIKPLWEDKENLEGGNFCFKVRKHDTEELWKLMILGVIGELISSLLEDDICGVTLSIRRDENVIDIWNKNASKFNLEKAVNAVKRLIPFARVDSPCYKVHKQELDHHKEVTSTPKKESHKKESPRKRASPPHKTPKGGKERVL
jgi:translation initiation factor 4E